MKTNGKDGVNREVPWRNGTKTDTATRAQLLSILVENATVPEFELINPKLTASESGAGADAGIVLLFTAELFISATARAMLPKHRWSLTVISPEWDDASTPLPRFDLTALPHTPNRPLIGRDANGPFLPPPEPEPESPQGVLVRKAGIYVNGSGSVKLSGRCEPLNGFHAQTVEEQAEFEVAVEMPVDRLARAASCRQRLTHVPNSRNRRAVGEWRSTR
ncbi:hypothetical protein [Rhodococcus opacus]|uniref:hypothetical protein n=1 Tax=Rhodococcus opacus TaxID=37919 RepID=UPI00294A0CF2|nr:hypothetical protein [Rhodococcus opacus]MDV6245288.1 hypothetical protein [Rhodococcus opacus]